MEDIVPELLGKIQKEFEEEIKKSQVLKDLAKKIADKTATYSEANEYAIEIGKKLAEVYQRNINSDILPNGKMYYNIASRIINPTLQENYNMVSEVSSIIQEALNEDAGIGIKVIVPEMNHDRVNGIVNRICHEENFDAISWILNEPVVNFSQGIVDDFIKKNSEFQGRAGMSPKITRKLAGNCCEWCAAVAGTYTYPDVPEDVYRRHQRCRCTVDYIPGHGKIQNVWTKDWSKNEKNIQRNIDLEQSYKPVKRLEREEIEIQKDTSISARRIDGYDNVYVEDGTYIKPRALHMINRNTEESIKGYGLEKSEKPRIVIVGPEKLGAYGKYDAISNTVYYLPQIAEKEKVVEIGGIGVTEHHEMCHFRQAELYRKQGKTITEDNYSTYMEELMKKSKKNIDSAGITEYNVGELGEYALKKYNSGRYDEVEAELEVKRRRK